ncbi:MAG TPA: outer membrane beta-barrel protein [Bacteroidales bacterium]|nr:outer membrane beta-barrel protein [Bacteroidales bacterium]
MKNKSVFVLFLTIVTSCCLNAQLFVGGSIGLSTSGGTEDFGTGEEDKTSYLSLDFGPMAGYFLSDNLAAGLRILSSIDRTKTPPYIEDGDATIATETTFGFVPFLRYYAVHFNKFSVFGQAQAGVTMGSEKTKTGSTETEGPKTTTIGFRVLPGVALEVGDHVMLEANINLFGFGFSTETEKFNDNKEKTNNFSFGVTMDNIATSGAISIGAIYIF